MGLPDTGGPCGSLCAGAGQVKTEGATVNKLYMNQGDLPVPHNEDVSMDPRFEGAHFGCKRDRKTACTHLQHLHALSTSQKESQRYVTTLGGAPKPRHVPEAHAWADDHLLLLLPGAAITFKCRQLRILHQYEQGECCSTEAIKERVFLYHAPH